MASKKGSGTGAKSRKKTGAAKRAQQKRVDRPGVLPPDPKTPQQAADWIQELGRIGLASGHAMRATVERNLQAIAELEPIHAAHHAPLKERGFSAALMAGLGLVGKSLAAPAEAQPAGAVALSPEVRAAYAFAAQCRAAVLRVLPGAGNAQVRRRFGFSDPLDPSSPASVRRACLALAEGIRTRRNGLTLAVFTSADAGKLDRHAAAIQKELTAASQQGRAGTRATTSRDIANAGIEKTFDLFAAAIGMALPPGEERVNILALIPRREERRGQAGEETGGGTGPASGAT